MVRNLAGRAPVWSVAFLPDNATLLTGGADGKIRRWNTLTGDQIGSSLTGTPVDPLAAYAGDHGAEVFRACVACHTLSEKDVQRAGPTLAGLYGRRIASLPGYRFSDALKKMDIIWTPDTVARLSRSARMPIRLALKCRSSASARRKTARRLRTFWPGLPPDNHPLVSRSRSRK